MFFDGFADNAVQWLNGVGGVNRPADVLRVVKQGVEIMPVRPP